MKVVTKKDLLFKESRINPICCIYMITSPSGKMYIGQTVNLYWRMYKYSKMHCDKQAKLYASFKKYGWDAHVFSILEECKKEDLNRLEVYYMELHETFNTEHGLNLRTGGDYYKLSDESKEKLRQANLGKKYSYETNYKKGVSLRGKNVSEESKIKMSNGQKIVWKNKERLEKASERVKGESNPMFGRFWTDEQKKAHGDKIRGRKGHMAGKKHSPETIAKMIESRKNISPETRLKMSISRTGKKWSDKKRVKMMEVINAKKQLKQSI